MSAHEKVCKCSCHDPMVRFWQYVDQAGDCWEWKAQINSTGYGKYYLGGKMRYAHRLAYEAKREAIPDGMTIDHLCRNRSCVNPDHLEVVTRAENSRRANTKQKEVAT